MKVIKQVNQSEVFNHWERVEKISISQRADIVFPLVAYQDLRWSLVRIEDSDLDKIYIISSDDWRTDGLCVPDFKLMTAAEKYSISSKQSGKYANIQEKENILTSDLTGLDTRFILVADNKTGPYTIIEGNRRAVALYSLNKLVGRDIYLGISPAIKNYIWSRHNF